MNCMSNNILATCYDLYPSRVVHHIIWICSHYGWLFHTRIRYLRLLLIERYLNYIKIVFLFISLWWNVPCSNLLRFMQIFHVAGYKLCLSSLVYDSRVYTLWEYGVAFSPQLVLVLFSGEFKITSQIGASLCVNVSLICLPSLVILCKFFIVFV